MMFSHLLVRYPLLVGVSAPHMYPFRTLCHRNIFHSSPVWYRFLYAEVLVPPVGLCCGVFCSATSRGAVGRE